MSILPGGARKVAALLVLLGCAAADPDASSPAASEAGAELVFCGEPRPEACTREYRPACGHRCAAPPCRAADRRSYGNACDACADGVVRAHTPGSCEGGAPEEAPKLR